MQIKIVGKNRYHAIDMYPSASTWNFLLFHYASACAYFPSSIAANYGGYEYIRIMTSNQSKMERKA